MMGRCCYCEGMYLAPNQRKLDNPRLGLHVSCFMEMENRLQDIEIVMRYLKANSGNEALAAKLKEMDEFRSRMARVSKAWKEIRESRQTNTQNPSHSQDQSKTGETTKP